MSEVELKLTADAGSALREVRAFSREYQAMVQALEKPIRQANALQKTQEDAKKAAAEFFAAKRSVEQLQRAMDAAGQPVAGLERELAKAERTLARTSVEFDRQKARIREQRMELRQAGIDTSRLADEQRRLQAEMDKAIGAGRNANAVSSIRARAAALQQQTVAQRQANLEAAREGLGVNRYRQLQAELVQVQRQYQLLRSSGRLTTQELAVAQRAMTERVRETQRALREMGTEQRRAGAGRSASGVSVAVGAAAAGYAAVSSVTALARAADAYTLMNARLKLATESQQEFNTAQTELRRIAAQTEAPVASLVTLYGRISRPLKEAGRSQADILRVTEAVATSFRVSGASAQEAEAGVIQFAQALGSGALRGDEFNSVAEQAPRLMQALADGIGVPVGALKEMAAQGELTASVVTSALVGQLDVLRKESETLPDTVGGAMTKLADRWNEAIGKADMQPLIEAIEKLGDTLSDPEVVDNLVRLASAMASLAGVAVRGGSEVVELGNKMARTAAQAHGYVSELEKLEQTLKEVQAAQSGSSFVGSNTVAQLIKYFAPERLDEWVKELEQKIVETRAKIAGLSVDAQQQLDAAAAREVESQKKTAEEQAKLYDKRVADYATYVDSLNKLRAEQLKAAEDASKKLVAAEQKATADLERIRAERVKIEQEYDEAIAGFRGGDGEASYGAANALRVQARQALQAGDVEGAKAAAAAALKMLRDLAAAGENTYGFEGFANDLKSIAVAASGIEETEAAARLKAVKDQVKDLAAETEKLKNIKVSVTADEESIQAVRNGIQALAAQLGQTQIVLPIAYAAPSMPTAADQPGFAWGGYTGPGGKYEVGGVVHKGEHVQPQEVVREPGALAFLERIRRNGFQATMQGLRGYAVGGLVAPTPTPIIPDLPPALMQQQTPGRDLGRVELSIGGESYSVLADPDNFDRILRRTAMKRGRTRV